MKVSFGKEHGQFVVGLILSLVPWLVAPRTIPPFASLYRAWGLDVPTATQMLIDHPHGLLALPFVVIATWSIPKSTKRRGIASLSAGFAAGALGYLSIVMLLYWPTFAA
jgi:hypothetical protein